MSRRECIFTVCWLVSSFSILTCLSPGNQRPFTHAWLWGALASETERGGAIERFREFVVFDGKYAYPEFLLAYKRTSVRPPDGLEPEPE